MSDKLKGYLGLAVRSGQAALGANMVLEQIRSGKAGVVLIDEDASDNTRKKLSDACAFRNVDLHILPAGLIAASCGKGDRMAAGVGKTSLRAGKNTG